VSAHPSHSFLKDASKTGHRIQKITNLKEWEILNILELYLMKVTITK
jgi:hypothetical protein